MKRSSEQYNIWNFSSQLSLMASTESKGQFLTQEMSKTLEILTDHSTEEEEMEEKIRKVYEMYEEFNELTSETWNSFMNNEMIFHRQMKVRVYGYRIILSTSL